MSGNDPFVPAKTKLKIASKDDPPGPGGGGLMVEAQYNPKELQVDQNVPWKKPDSANQTGGSGGGAGNQPMTLEFTGAEGRTMTVELLFDGYEQGANARKVDVAKEVGKLQQLAAVRNPQEKDEKKRRPHQCVVSWGGAKLPNFECVIENLSVKYSMFSSEGEPLRATCTVKLKEAQAVDKTEKKGGS
jgi:hypothetical protein